MLKRLLLLCLMSVCTAVLPAFAEVQQNYIETFDNDNPATSGYHPKGWSRHSYSSYYAATYSAVETSAGDNAVKVVQRYPNIPAYDDYLITPPVSGKVTLKVKLADDGGSMKFYAVSESSNGTFTKGEELTPDVNPELSADGFVELEFSDIPTATRLGLRGHNVVFDDFTAQTADVTYLRSIKSPAISLEASEPAFTKSGSTYTIELDASKMLTLKFDVRLTNDGEVPFTPGEEGYSLTLSADNTEFGTLPVEQTLNPGESIDDTFIYTFDASALSGAVTFRVTENISDSYDWQKITIVPYASEFRLQSSESTSSYNSISNGTTLNFGSAQTAQTETVWVYNTGTAPLEYTLEVDGDGFAASTGGVLRLEAGEHVACAIATVADGNFGPRTGAVIFKGDDFGEFTLNLKANMLDPDRWYENFSDKKLPDDMIDEANVWSFTTGKAAVTYNSAGGKLVTPRLTVTDPSEALTVTIAKNGTSSYTRATFKAYRSTDRINWEEIAGDFDAADLTSTYEEYTLTGIEPGDYYIGLECTNVYISELYGFSKAQVAHDVVVTDSSLPAQGEVNSLYTASMTVRNVGPALADGSYTVVLTSDGARIATAQGEALAPGASATYTLSYTPHAAVEAAAMRMALVAADDSDIAAAEATDVAISEEVMRSDVQVGTTGTATTDKAPVKTNSKYTYSDIIYSADAIPLDAGAKVNRIAFKGNVTSSGVKNHIKVWVENTDLATIPSSTNTWSALTEEDMTKEFDWEFPSVSGDEVLVIDLADAPFAYTGGNIRMRFINVAETTGSVKYYYDSKAGKAAYDYDSSATYSPRTYSADAPVVFLSVEARPIVVSGIVTDASTSDPISGAKVTVKSGDVEYYATTDASGTYTAELKKNLDSYVVEVACPGYFPYSAPLGEVADNAATHNAVLNPARDLYIKAQTVPSEAVVNCAIATSVLVQNVNATPFEAGSYSVSLLVDGNVAETAEGVALEANNADFDNEASEHLYTFDYTFHAAGNRNISYAVAWGDGERMESVPVDVPVDDEKSEGEITIGTPDSFVNKAPASFFAGYSTSSTLYPADKIDMPAGAEITEINYKGYYSAYRTTSANIEIWIANTDDDADSAPVFDTTEMIKIVDQEISITSAGSAYSPTEIMSFELAEPFRYTGGNLRIVVRAESDGSTTNFEADPTGKTYYKENYSSWEAMDASSASSTDMVVVNMTFSNSRRYTGVVIDQADGTPVSGAQITLSSDNVKYTGTSDEVGQFEVPVIQHAKDYSLHIAASGYHPLHLELVDLSTPLTHQLVKSVDSIELPEADAEQPDEPVYNIQGVRVDDSYRGIKISRGRKVLDRR